MKKIKYLLFLVSFIILGALLYKYGKSLYSCKVVCFDSGQTSYAGILNDRNGVQIPAAKKKGLKNVLKDREDLARIEKEGGLVKLSSCQYYYLAGLTYSAPYLLPEAAKELEQIGLAFQNALEDQGYPQYRIIVTSVLRTRADVAKLVKVNHNATRQSAHCYGTTFDISYNKYLRCGFHFKRNQAEDLTKVLGEVLQKERKEGRIYVLYESNQPCFHITVR